jgi:hypothetical protein
MVSRKLYKNHNILACFWNVTLGLDGFEAKGFETYIATE